MEIGGKRYTFTFGTLSSHVKGTSLQQVFLSSFYMLDYNFSKVQ